MSLEMASTSSLVFENMFEQSLKYNSVPESVLEWLAPRISFSISFAQLDAKASPKNESSDTFSSDFEFSIGSFSDEQLSTERSMTIADELFVEGKLVPMPVLSQDLTHPPDQDREARDLKVSPAEGSSNREPFACSPQVSSSNSPSSFLSRLSSLKAMRWFRSRNTIRSLFQPNRNVNVQARTGSEESESSLEVPVRCSFGSKSSSMPNFISEGFSKTTQLPDRVRAKPSQAIAALLWIPSHTMSCCSLPSQNLDRIAIQDEAVNECDRHRQKTGLKSGKSICKRDSFDSFRRMFSSGSKDAILFQGAEKGFKITTVSYPGEGTKSTPTCVTIKKVHMT